MRRLAPLLFLAAAALAIGFTPSAPEPRAAVAPTRPEGATPQLAPPEMPGALALMGPPRPPDLAAPAELPQSIPADAIAAVADDIRDVAEADRFFHRWVWSQSGEAEDWKALSDTLARISRAPFIRRPAVRGIVARIDLRWYAPRDQDIADWIRFWEQLQFDPSFSLLITADTLKLLTEAQRATIQVPCRRIVWDGDRDTGRRVLRAIPLVELRDVVVVRLNADHLRQTPYTQIQAATVSIAPIVELRYFVGRVLSTIKDRDVVKGKAAENVFSTIWGGLYYEFAGVRASQKKGRTDLGQLLFDVAGIDEPLDKFFDRLRSDSKVAVFRSEVTGHPRAVLSFAAPTARLSDASPIVVITLDLRNRDVDVLSHPMANLLAFEVQAFEVLWTLLDGSQGGAIYGAEQQLLEAAGQDVVADHDIPKPYTPILQGGISCIRCHGVYDGWQPLKNDAKVLLSYYLDVFGDTADARKSIPDTVARIAGLYSGDPRKMLSRARDDLAEATLRATGPWKGDGAQTNTVKLSSARISRIYAQDRYTMVDASLALRDLGFVPEKGINPATGVARELEQLRRVLPPEKAAATVVNGVAIIPEDFRVGGLLAGLSINRTDWALAYNFALTRTSKQRGKP